MPKYVWNTMLKALLSMASLRERGAFRTVSDVQDGAFEKMFNMVLWIYLWVWICFVIRICQGSEYARDTEGTKYAWVLNNSQTCLNMPETEPKITVQAK